ncbi:MAG TPA: hypothetical protein VLL25_02850 [Acidimicrobiales bacterium]|nr:hypothetical protein [Acidimicrobiales bacterium]
MVADTGDAVVVRLQWRLTGPSEDRGLYQVLRIRDSKVIDIEDYRSDRAAMKAAKSVQR